MFFCYIHLDVYRIGINYVQEEDESSDVELRSSFDYCK